MPTTIDELEKRLTSLETRMSHLQQMLERGIVEETPDERGARLLREAKFSQARLDAGWNEAMRAMGIRGKPIEAEKLQERIAASDLKSKNNEFIQGIVQMRSE